MVLAPPPRRKPDLPPRASGTRCPVARRHLAMLWAALDALRGEYADLLADRAHLIDELAARDDHIELMEREVDSLRMVLGLREVPG